MGVILALALFRAFPSYDALGTDFFKATWRDAQLKFDHPLLDMARVFPPGSHQSKLTYRLTVPILAHVFHLGETALLVFSGIVGALLLFLILQVTFDLTGSRRIALCVCLSTACAWPGATAFHDLRGGYYDALALCLVVAAFATSSAIWAGVFVFLAAWTDERALIAALFLLFLGKRGAVLGALVAFVATRICVMVAYSYAFDAGGIGLSVLTSQIKMIPLAIWTGLAGSWILVAFGARALFAQQRYWEEAGFSALLIGMIAASMAVADMTRSMAYCLPAVFVAVRADVRRIEKLAGIAAAISFVVPTFYLEGSAVFWLYPLPMQLARWLLPT